MQLSTSPDSVLVHFWDIQKSNEVNLVDDIPNKDDVRLDGEAFAEPRTTADIRCVLRGSESVEKDMNRIRKAMQNGIGPVFVGDTDASTGECYYMRDISRRIVSVFKPERGVGIASRISANNDEDEAQLRRGFPKGGRGNREVAAFLLDVEPRVVPRTTLASVAHPVLASKRAYEIGSLQSYAQHFCSAEDISSSRFSVNDVHRIALLDIRIFNTDRHAGNLLVALKNAAKNKVDGTITNARDLTKANTSLVAIDHGLCLPEFPFLAEATFVWMGWSQAREPISAEMRDYIRKIDIEADITRLRQTLGVSALSRAAILTFQICTLWLQLATEANFSFFEMAQFMCRPDLDMDSPSPLERIILRLKLATSFSRIPSLQILKMLRPAMLDYIKENKLQAS